MRILQPGHRKLRRDDEFLRTPANLRSNIRLLEFVAVLKDFAESLIVA